MSMATSSVVTTQHALAELGLSREQFGSLEGAVAAVFTVFARRFSHRWAPTFNDSLARSAWQFDFENVKLTPREILGGIIRVGVREWPPSTGEFIALCRDYGVPSVAAGLAEAVRARQVGFFEHAWSHPVVGAAARAIGTWGFANSSAHDLGRQWQAAWTEALEAHRMGRLVLSTTPQLTHQPISEPEYQVPRMSAAEAMQDLARWMGVEAAP